MLALLGKGDSAAVLRLIAAWEPVGSPTLAARVAEGRALLELRLVDRALARAREAIEVAPSDRAAMRLLAEAYLDRGWPLRARPVLDNLRAAGEDVAALTARLALEPTRPEALAREVEVGGSFEDRLRLAEQFMAAGIASRAGALLEKLAAERPAHGRVESLRWALAGQFAGREPIELQVKRALPAILELSAVPEESEHTESLTGEAGLLLEPEPVSAPFPPLFKRAPTPSEPLPPGSPEDEEEKTANTLLPEGAPAPVALTSLTGGSANDTQILMVVGEGEGGPMHRKREEAGRTLNLREWQASMGVDPLASDLDGVELSEELRLPDRAPLVETVHAPRPAPEPEVGYDRPIEVIERHPVPDPTLLLDIPLEEVEEAGAPARDPRPLRLLLGAAFFAGFLLVLFLLLMIVARASGLLDAARANVDLSRGLGSADYASLVEHEQRLAAHADSPAERVELARARTVLWSEYQGDRGMQQEVEALIADPVGVDTHSLAYLRAAQLLTANNPASALAAIGREPPLDDEERLILARAHAGLGDAEAALADLEGLLRPDDPRYRLGRAGVLVALGRRAEARAVVTLLLGESPNLIAARLAELQLRDGTPAERAGAARVFLKTYGSLGISPRQAAGAALVEAQAWMDAGDPERAVRAAEAGIARDGTHRELLLLLAREDVRQGELVVASRRLGTLWEMYRADPEAQQALLLVLLDLERVTEAQAVVDAANPPRQALFQALVQGMSGGGTPAPPQVEFTGPLGLWARALLAAAGREEGAAALAADAAKALAESPDILESRLAARAQAFGATILPEPAAAQAVTKLRGSGIADAAAHVYIARYFESVGNRTLAAQHFDRAADLEPELGVALYEKGRFYADAEDPLGRSTEAWQAFLGLAPSGPRADRARGVARVGPG